MRMQNKNKEILYYALLTGTEPVYETDENGDIIYVEVDGNNIPVETGDKKLVYSKPVKFIASISTSGGDSETFAYGVSTADYEATIVTPKNCVPLEETSLIWHNKKPQYNKDGTINPDSADYTIVKISPSLNSVKYALKEVVK